ncbi:LytR/AlgR family response regulator transcription factor [Sediminicola luteus]|uniref:DNA-binding response regulator n=1 Tax=Sediminicola luteus TaxID=319238 RepID=A0A2A4GEW8_9FLAO|nr:LytTR family DNA-binding domain-containing protein [Sediminicola luteus]PCE66292.1 DNA-binding response regulator [Sediminicola luteus]
MRAVVIDDEIRARNLLKTLISENCPKIQEVYLAKSLLEGVALIEKENPQIVFLDIDMPEHSGLEILNYIEKELVDFEIVFTTAHSEYALQAFQLAAIDYLLKPLRPKQLKAAVEKCIDIIGKSKINDRLVELKTSLSAHQFEKIALPVSDGIKFINFKELVLFEADGMYTKIYTISDGEIMISKPLKHFVELLHNIAFFFRPHRSFLINLSFIKQYVKTDGGYIVLDNGKTVSISNDKKEAFLKLVSGM